MLHDHEIAEMESLIENGLVTKRKHPSMDIWICNYTPYMQYRNAWTPVGERCRGLIVDDPFGRSYDVGGKVVESPDLDGSYGTNGDAIFFFTTEGAYVEWAGEYICSDFPLSMTTPPELVRMIE